MKLLGNLNRAKGQKAWGLGPLGLQERVLRVLDISGAAGPV